MTLFVKQSTRNVLTHVAVGMGAASFWRGAWYLLDDHLFPDNAEHSAAASLALGVMGMTTSQGLMHKCEVLAQRKFTSLLALRVARFGALYTVAVSCVLVWRGTWVGWDCIYERFHPHNHAGIWGGHASETTTQAIKSTDRGHATHSGLLSHFTALTLLLGTGLFASVLAPPAAVSVIRDWAIRTGSHTGAGSGVHYQGPGQVLVQRLFGRLTSSSASSSAAGNSAKSNGSYNASAAATARALSTRAKSQIPRSPLIAPASTPIRRL